MVDVLLPAAGLARDPGKIAVSATPASWAGDTSDTPQLRRQDWLTIAVIGIAHAASHFFQLVIPSLYVPLAQAFDLDFARLGLLVSAFYVVSGLGQASSGFVVDRIGARPVLWFGLSCFVAAAILIGTATGYGMLLLAACVGGVGNSVFHPVDYSLINHRISSRRLGHAFSAHGLTGSLGWALAPLFIATLTTLWGWRVAAFGVAVLVVVVLALTVFARGLLTSPGTARKAAHPATGAAARVAPAAAGSASAAVSPAQADAALRAATPGEQVVPPTSVDEPAPAVATPTAMETLRALLAKPALWGAFLFFACTSIALSSVQNYTIPLLHDLYGVTAILASSALSGYMVASAVGMIAGGFLVSAQPHVERIVAISLVLAGATLVLLASGSVPAGWAAAVIMVAGFCSGVAAPSRDMLIRRVTPKGAVGSVYGLVYCGMDVGAAVGPMLFGLMLDVGMLRGPWIGAGIAFAAAALLAQWIALNARRAGQ